jgi:hypothetical protein
LAFNDESNNPMMQRVLYIESWIKVDYDGDGLPELRKICTLGDGHTIVNNEPADFIPFADFPCDPEPHTSPLEANSIFDYTKDLQEIKSDILRNTLDSLAQSIHPRTAVVEGQVNIDDVLNNETGAIVRMRSPGMVQALTTPFVGREAFSMLDYIDQVKENRTGMSKASMGLNADALQSSTKAAVAATISASQSRLELTTRILANGMKKLFKNVLQLIVTRQDKPRIVRLRNQWVAIDPRAWTATMDVSVNVALGNGDTDQKMAMLQLILSQQKEALMQMGPQNPLVTPAQFSNTLRKMVELAGFKDSSQFFNAVPADYQPPQQQNKPSPEEMLGAGAGAVHPGRHSEEGRRAGAGPREDAAIRRPRARPRRGGYHAARLRDATQVRHPGGRCQHQGHDGARPRGAAQHGPADAPTTWRYVNGQQRTT